MAIEKSSAPHAHPFTEEHDDTLEAHYPGLERPCACLEGWVFVGYMDEHGEEREASYQCRRCADGRQPRSKALTHDYRARVASLDRRFSTSATNARRRRMTD